MSQTCGFLFVLYSNNVSQRAHCLTHNGVVAQCLFKHLNTVKIHRLSFRDVLPKSYCSLQPEAVDICMSISTAVFVMVIQNCDVEDLF